MTVIADEHEAHGATFEERGGRRVVTDYGRPERTHRAVRNGAGVVEMGYGVVLVEGDDRHEFVDNAVTNHVPTEEGEGSYALLLDPQGRVETDMYLYEAGERLLLFTPPDRAEPLVEDWSEKTFIQDVELTDASSDFGVFGVHGPKSTEKVASVLHNASVPEEPLSFVRGATADVGITVMATDAPTGEEGYEVVCAAEDAAAVFDSLIARGLNAPPFGYRTWETLTLEAGTPLFDSELAGRLPNVVGLRNALDFDKGCYVGQEVVSKVENQGRPSRRLVGLRPESVPEPNAPVLDADGDAVGTVTRAADCPSLEGPAALALVDFDAAEGHAFTVGAGVGAEVDAERADLPFYEGSMRSARLPSYVVVD
ncbi:aminomethyltransferase family protein [Halobium salinum]|uniref:Aminomethyltransferase family protein n=1 Tax=Halobium salinum TaxID=1364940 RepID=A0ABD5PCD2_9EURY|nr:aminomethyltransferase family protein [Halobium salinum]